MEARVAYWGLTEGREGVTEDQKKSPRSLGFILWAPLRSVPNSTVIFLIIFKKSQNKKGQFAGDTRGNIRVTKVFRIHWIMNE